MCVAVLVETKAGPTPHELWQMEDANPHGAGVAWASGDLIRYKKGLTWLQVRELLERIPRPALVHFRWATHGPRTRYLSHPFPIGPRALTSRKLNGAARAVLIHNGVWNDYHRFAPGGVDLDKWSDTAVAAYAAGVIGEEILDHVDWSNAIGRAGGEGRMDVTLRGMWTPHNGNMYSNLSWIPRKKIYGYINTRGGLEWRDEPTPTPGLEDPGIDAILRDVDGVTSFDGYRWNDQGRLVRTGVVSAKSWGELAEATIPAQAELPLNDDKPISVWLDEYEAAANAKAGEGTNE